MGNNDTQTKTEYEKTTTNAKPAGGNGRKYTDTEKTKIRNYGYQEEVGQGAGDWFSNLFTTDYFWNQNREPAVAFNFFLRIEAAFDAPCRSVRAFTKENEFEEIQEGGRNDYVILKRKPNTRRFTLQVERYVGIDKVDPLQLGTEMILPMILAVSRVTSSGDGGFVDTMTETEFIRFYAFTGCIVTGKEYGELNAEQSGLLKEVTTIAYREMIALSTPNADLVKKPWDVTDPLKNRRRPETFAFFDKAKAVASRWEIKNAPNGVAESTDKSANETKPDITDARRAVRPVNDSTHAVPKRWGGSDTAHADENVNKSASRPVPSNANPVPKMWGGVDSKNRDFKRDKSADPNKYDGQKAEVAGWKITRDAKNTNNRSATAPPKDDKRAKVRSWNMDPTLPRQSKATKPQGDKKKAKVQYFTVKRPAKNKKASKPEVDTVRAEVGGYDIETNSGKVAAAPSKDKARAEKNLRNSKYSNKMESTVSTRSRLFSIKQAKVSSSKAKSIKWQVKSPKSSRKAEAPKQDDKRSTAKRWDIKKPALNRSAVTIKGAAEVARFLSGGR